MNRLSDNDRLQVLQDATAQFWQHIVPLVQIVCALHVLLLGLFALLQVPVMLAVNLVSVPVYLVCLRAIRRSRFRLAGMLISLEIIAHGLVATWVLGWDSNFHLYLYCVIPIVAFCYQAAPVRRALLALAIIGILVGGYTARHALGLQPGIAPPVLEAMGVANALFATALLLHASVLLVRFILAMQLGMYDTAYRDSLTQLYTRRRIMQRVRQLGTRAGAAPAALILLDVDHFKRINDRHGHDHGDLILQRVAAAITASVRSTDLAARWGGEEFLILMPATPLADARQIAERLRERIRENTTGVIDGAAAVTATMAVGALLPGEAFREALKRTDALLYQGKQQGRDRVMVAPQMCWE